MAFVVVNTYPPTRESMLFQLILIGLVFGMVFIFALCAVTTDYCLREEEKDARGGGMV
jgi:hypothetical protein